MATVMLLAETIAAKDRRSRRLRGGQPSCLAELRQDEKATVLQTMPVSCAETHAAGSVLLLPVRGATSACIQHREEPVELIIQSGYPIFHMLQLR